MNQPLPIVLNIQAQTEIMRGWLLTYPQSQALILGVHVQFLATPYYEVLFIPDPEIFLGVLHDPKELRHRLKDRFGWKDEGISQFIGMGGVVHDILLPGLSRFSYAHCLDVDRCQLLLEEQ